MDPQPKAHDETGYKPPTPVASRKTKIADETPRRSPPGNLFRRKTTPTLGGLA